MKYLSLFMLVLSVSAIAEDKNLSNGREYTVPDGMVWVIEDAPLPDCRVCTSDLYVKGAMSQAEVRGVVFNGTFEISFSDENNGPIKLLSGTIIRLGDSRPTIKVNEQKQ
jgi:hypothetical protein